MNVDRDVSGYRCAQIRIEGVTLDLAPGGATTADLRDQ